MSVYQEKYWIIVHYILVIDFVVITINYLWPKLDLNLKLYIVFIYINPQHFTAFFVVGPTDAHYTNKVHKSSKLKNASMASFDIIWNLVQI